jgi:hypothetical protein
MSFESLFRQVFEEIAGVRASGDRIEFDCPHSFEPSCVKAKRESAASREQIQSSGGTTGANPSDLFHDNRGIRPALFFHQPTHSRTRFVKV